MMPHLSPPVPRCPICQAPRPPGGPPAQCPQCLWRVCLGELAPDGPDEEPWLVIGDYELLGEIARGGMGIVYRARQRRLDRIVAMKVLRDSEVATNETRRRFLAESRTVAQLHHPGIVSVHDSGDDAGLLWFSMDYLPGGNLARFGDPLRPARDAAHLVATIAEAVQHAHAHGVLHRDLKPSNILLGDDLRPRVTDFGLARILSADAHAQALTRTGQALGSPGYTAPEQALDGEASPSGDVYGLGALLYFLLTGRPPFQGPTPESILLQLREHDPVPPRRLNPAAPRDLEIICQSALRKEPSRRYATAQALADDLARFLRDEPIHARPLSPPARAARWARRRPGSALLLGTVAALALALVASGVFFAHRQAQLLRRTALVATAQPHPMAHGSGERTRALAALREAWQIAPSAEIRTAAIAWLCRPEITFETTLDADAAPTPGPRSPEAAAVTTTTLPRGLAPSSAVLGFDARDGLVVIGATDRFLHVWDAPRGERVHRLSGHDAPPDAVAFRHHGQEFASAAADGHLRVWHAARGVEVLHVEGTSRHRAPMWWSADDSRLHCTRDDGRIDVFRVQWPRAARLLAPPTEEPRTENLQTLAVSPDGRLAASVDETLTRVWNLATGRVERVFPKASREWMSVAFSPDGSTLWLCGFDSGLRRVPVTTGAPALGPEHIVSPVRGALLAGLSPDGERIALSQNTTGEWLVLTLPDAWLRLPQTAPFRIAFAPDGRSLVTTSLGRGELTFRALPDGAPTRRLALDSPVERLAFAPDGRSLWVVTERDVQRLDLASDLAVLTVPIHGRRDLVFSPDGSLATSHLGNAVLLLDPGTLVEIARLTPPPATGWLGNATLRFDADASLLVAQTALGALVVWDLVALRQDLRNLGMDWRSKTRN